MSETVRLTTAQAIIKYLENQWIELDGERQRICGGGFGIFGHGNVTCLGEAMYEAHDKLPLYRGQHEQSMGFAAAAYAKFYRRKRFMFCTASAGPGTANLVTSSALAMANRLPMLMLCGDNFVTRLPDPVLQQVEHFNNPSLGVTDSFKAVTRYWDRITHPAQILQSLPQALGVLLDPADCGPAFIGLPQDVQGWTYDYPVSFFEPVVHRVRAIMPDPVELEQAAQALAKAKTPLIIAGGGVQYGDAIEELRAFAERHQIPVVETIAGRANLLWDHPLNCGPIGVTGSESANNLANLADVVLCVGTRLQDFTTGSWSVFALESELIKINPARFDALKHRGTAVVAGAKESLPALSALMGAFHSSPAWLATAAHENASWALIRARNTDSQQGPNRYAQVIGVINGMCSPEDRIVAAAGGLPAELAANWRTLATSSVDIEFGFSCMGYEIAGGWGARIAQSEIQPDSDTIVWTGDGSYLLMNSDIYSAVLTEKKLIIMVLDNGGFAVINKLQKGKGNESYNNLIADTPTASNQHRVDFAAHAQSMGATSERVDTVEQLQAAFLRAKASTNTYVIVMNVDPYDGWTTEGHAWWEVGTPAISNSASVTAGHEEVESGRARQRKGV
ncbi:3D-(3,5/4)-trihydroxycyclohexane-1,2-dione acylhydrolase (decyclizing) [Reinekea forsetii]|nr:3D-(3,5/4)-trihydroxycyclohexane-1,2-dione acylhydrolase (decyclizing) [Reinekea forsetii]